VSSVFVILLLSSIGIKVSRIQTCRPDPGEPSSLLASRP
jgi:hypothetical protein